MTEVHTVKEQALDSLATSRQYLKDIYNISMLNSNQNYHHIEFIQNLPDKFRNPILLSGSKVITLEESELILPDVKIEILELLQDYRLMTEIITQKNELKKVLNFVEILEIPNFQKTYTIKGKKKYLIHLFRNIATLKYFVQFGEEIGAIELGLLYGYHPKSILSFMRLERPTNRKYNKSPYQRYNNKVMSNEFFSEEDSFHKEKWEVLREISPRIIQEAEKV